VYSPIHCHDPWPSEKANLSIALETKQSVRPDKPDESQGVEQSFDFGRDRVGIGWGDVDFFENVGSTLILIREMQCIQFSI